MGIERWAHTSPKKTVFILLKQINSKAQKSHSLTPVSPPPKTYSWPPCWPMGAPSFITPPSNPRLWTSFFSCKKWVPSSIIKLIVLLSSKVSTRSTVRCTKSFQIAWLPSPLPSRPLPPKAISLCAVPNKPIYSHSSIRCAGWVATLTSKPTAFVSITKTTSPPLPSKPPFIPGS